MSSISWIRGGHGGDNDKDVAEYKHAEKKAKHGLSMVMDGLEQQDEDLIIEGARKALKGIDKMCEISDEMEEQFSSREWDDDERERRGGRSRSGMFHSREEDWDRKDDQMLHERVMRRYRR